MLSRLPRLYQRTRAMSTTANVWVNKDTRCIVQGFTGKQVCHFDLVFLPLLNYIILFNIFIYLICCFFLFFLSSFLPFFLSSFLLFSSFFFLSLSSFHFSHFTLRYCILSALPLFHSFFLSFFVGNVSLGASDCIQQRYCCWWCLTRKRWNGKSWSSRF